MRLNHLAIEVRDVERSQAFYQRYFAFDGRQAEWREDVLFLRDAAGFDFGLLPTPGTPSPGTIHFGFQLPTPDSVRELRNQMAREGVPIIDQADEPNYVSFKCTDPDGYVVELYWEPLRRR